MTILYQPLFRAGHYIVSESNGYRSREQGMIASGSGVLLAGTVLGRIATGTATSSAKAGGNTGNGVLTVDLTTPILPGAKNGVYRARVTAAAANGGTFRVSDPDGEVLGDVAVGATFADQIKFSIADGATDFIVGDEFDISVALGTGKYAPFNPAATDGSEIASAILYEGCDATSADARRTLSVRDTEVNAGVLQWADGVTDSQKTAALAALAASGIVGR